MTGYHVVAIILATFALTAVCLPGAGIPLPWAVGLVAAGVVALGMGRT